ncbi:hypothetical protein T01_12233 [Trichinella spiralis]|uniref:Uncharacterized protein n=1 Tax=Trichinella spiralis TaxID=6334 RepID=A0A0V1C1L2_TRISP|nr:hypothetical protein T01_12233 [Trichinella spiralis]
MKVSVKKNLEGNKNEGSLGIANNLAYNLESAILIAALNISVKCPYTRNHLCTITELCCTIVWNKNEIKIQMKTEKIGNTVLIVGRNYENLLYNKLSVRKHSTWNMGLYNLHHQAKKNQKLLVESFSSTIVIKLNSILNYFYERIKLLLNSFKLNRLKQNDCRWILLSYQLEFLFF